MAATDLVQEQQVDALAAAIVADTNGVRALIGALGSLTTADKTTIVAAINEVNAKAGTGGGTAATNLTFTRNATTVTVASDTGADAVLPVADATNAGVMGASQASKLAGIATNADVTSATNVGSVAAAAAAKASPVDADTIPLTDSQASNALKKVSISTLKNVVIAAIQSGAPALLDTIDELAAALGDDPNAITAINTALGNRLRVDAAQGLNATQQAQGRSNLGIAISTLNFATAYNAAKV